MARSLDRTEVGRSYYAKEDRTIQQAKLVGLSKPQLKVLGMMSMDIWVTAKELGTTTATVRTLAKRGLVLTSMIDSELCFKARYHYVDK